jgi:serine-type D-Ala-D-Ala carboxypeptidase
LSTSSSARARQRRSDYLTAAAIVLLLLAIVVLVRIAPRDPSGARAAADTTPLSAGDRWQEGDPLPVTAEAGTDAGAGVPAGVGGGARRPRGVPPAALDAAERLVARGVGDAYPGAVLAVGTGPTVDRITALGKIGWRDASPPVVADSTIYDLASLTKAVATTVAVLLLAQDGTIDLDAPVRRHLPEFEGRWKDDVTWRHLLTHTSGLPPGAAIRGNTPAERGRRILRTLLAVPPGRQVAYSDVGFVALWAAAQRAAGEPLPRMLDRRVWQPLGMHDTHYNPGRDCEWCAPTLRLQTGEPFRGLPADLMGRQLAGHTGNAGLFSTGPDLARFMAMVGGGGELDGVRILTPESVAELFRQQPGAGRRTLGWTAFCPDEAPDAAIACAAPLAYGHTGWTGTSLWLNPRDGRWTVLLTNRSYERPNRPAPLDDLRRDLFLTISDNAARAVRGP